MWDQKFYFSIKGKTQGNDHRRSNRNKIIKNKEKELTTFEYLLRATCHDSHLCYLSYEMHDTGLDKLMDICVH